MNTGSNCRLAVTLGDPRGIGPEVAIAAAATLLAEASPHFIFIGPDDANAQSVAHEYIPVGKFNGSVASAGRISGLAIEKAVELALSGDVDAIVTGPIDKFALNAAGHDFPGHTEMLAALSKTKTVVMMLAAEKTRIGGALRVVLATTHLRLADVPAALTSDLLVEQTLVTHRALQQGWRIAKPAVALCAFNPHASDGGLFGDEEARIYGPAIQQLRAEGIDVSPPLPADTVFLRAARGEFDVVVAPYHDVGMAAFKTAAFGQGVNVTLGLPFIRTSPDHGTAMNIAGSGVADSSSMEEAMRLAIRLANDSI